MALKAAIAPRQGPGALAPKGKGPIEAKEQWEIDPSELDVGERVAVGGFAEVFIGTWAGSQVAIKALLVRLCNASGQRRPEGGRIRAPAPPRVRSGAPRFHWGAGTVCVVAVVLSACLLPPLPAPLPAPQECNEGVSRRLRDEVRVLSQLRRAAPPPRAHDNRKSAAGAASRTPALQPALCRGPHARLAAARAAGTRTSSSSWDSATSPPS